MARVRFLAENPNHNAPFVRSHASEGGKMEYPCFHFLICEEPVVMLLVHWAVERMGG